jgi:hypothetical protein
MPSRRRLAAYATAAALLALTGGSVLLVVGVTQTGTGREYVRRQLVDAIEPRLLGRLYVGPIRGNVFTGVTVDSLELRGPDDSLFVAVGRLRVDYRPGDLWDRRVLLRRVEIDRPVLRIAQGEDNVWNFRRLLRRRPPSAPRTGPGFGDYVVADSVVVRGGTFTLTQPWHPADSLRGAARDSAVRYNLGLRARGGPEIRRRGGRFFARTYRWTNIAVVSPYVRLADRDSTGRRFVLARVDADESDPPFRWRNVRGDVLLLGDTVWARADHWDLPGSTGRGRAKIVFGGGLPVRYAVHVDGDSVSLRDVAWVYPTLPRTGGGRMALDIRNAPGNLRVLEYALSGMDVRTTKSRLTGAMTFAVGGPVLGVKDVALRAQPVDFDLLRALAGGPFPVRLPGHADGDRPRPRRPAQPLPPRQRRRHVRRPPRARRRVARARARRARHPAAGEHEVPRLRRRRRAHRHPLDPLPQPRVPRARRRRARHGGARLELPRRAGARRGVHARRRAGGAHHRGRRRARHVRREGHHVRPRARRAAAVVHHARAELPAAAGARHLRRAGPRRGRDHRPARRRAAHRRGRHDGVRRAGERARPRVRGARHLRARRPEPAPRRRRPGAPRGRGQRHRRRRLLALRADRRGGHRDRRPRAVDPRRRAARRRRRGAARRRRPARGRLAARRGAARAPHRRRARSASRPAGRTRCASTRGSTR